MHGLDVSNARTEASQYNVVNGCQNKVDQRLILRTVNCFSCWLSFRIPCHSFTCHWIRITFIVLCLHLWSLPTHKLGGKKWQGILQLLLRALFEHTQMETNEVSPDYQKHQHLHNISKFTVIIINRHAIYTHLHHFYSKGTGSAKCFPVQQRTLRGQEQSRSSCPKFPAYWLYYPLITGSGSTQLCAVENYFIMSAYASHFHLISIFINHALNDKCL